MLPLYFSYLHFRVEMTYLLYYSAANKANYGGSLLLFWKPKLMLLSDAAGL